MTSRRRATPDMIDEGLIRDLIGGHTPALTHRQEGPTENIQSESAGDTTNYEALFLRPVRIRKRVACYVEQQTKQKLEMICQRLGTGLTLGALLENIIRHHFETYRKEINEMIQRTNDKITI